MNASLFSRMRLGYVLIESQRMEAWHRFATEGLGLHAEAVGAGGLALRLDDRARRLVVRPGPAEDVVAMGWQLDDQEALQQALARLHGMGIAVEALPGAQAQGRGIEAGWRCRGPKGTAIELFTLAQVRLSAAPLRMRASGFVTGDSGLGHLAITSREPEAMERFWVQAFDARVSDTIVDRMGGVTMDFTFLRLNERHHSVAIASTRGLRLNPLRTSIHHLNLQVASLEDVMQGYLKCRELGYSIANGIGQHPNDRELSFYVKTPSDFEIELGWNPLVVSPADEAGWQCGHYQGISRWGHFPENLTLGLRARQFARGLWSLTRREERAGAVK